MAARVSFFLLSILFTQKTFDNKMLLDRRYRAVMLLAIAVTMPTGTRGARDVHCRRNPTEYPLEQCTHVHFAMEFTEPPGLSSIVLPNLREIDIRDGAYG